MPDPKPSSATQAARSATAHIEMIGSRILDLEDRIRFPRDGDVPAETLEKWIGFEVERLPGFRRALRDAEIEMATNGETPA